MNKDVSKSLMMSAGYVNNIVFSPYQIHKIIYFIYRYIFVVFTVVIAFKYHLPSQLQLKLKLKK